MSRWRTAGSIAAALLGCLAMAALLTWTAFMTFWMSVGMAPAVLLLGPPQLALYCVRYAFRRSDQEWTGNASLLTNIPLFMTGWAVGGGLAAAVVVGSALLPITAAERPRFMGVSMIAAQLAILAWLWSRARGLVESDVGMHPALQPLFNSIVLVGMGSAMLSLLVTGPAQATLIAAQCAFDLGWRPMALFVAFAAVPSLFAGLGLLRRAAWMFEARRQVANLATSTARAAAAGLVELRGKAVGVEGAAIPLSSPFELEDGTGRVRVEVPARFEPGSDERLWLERGSGGRLKLESKVPAGTEVLVIGEFVSPAALRPWKPPFVRFLQPVVDRLVDETLQRDADTNWNQLGFGAPREVFLVTDLSEEEAKEKLFSAWKRVMALGILLTAAAGVLLRLAWAAWR